MSNFWKTSDGKAVEKTSTHESGGGFEVIPEGTNLLAVIDDAAWTAGFDHGPDLIKIKWTVLSPAEYKNRVIFQNVKVNDEKEKTADNAKRMLMAIDQNAGGKLSKLDKEPGDDELVAALANKTMIIKVAVWDMNDKKGNWVCAVSPNKPIPAKVVPEKAASPKAQTDEAAPEKAPTPKAEPAAEEDMDPSIIPF